MGFEIPAPFENLDGEIGYAQFGGHLVERVDMCEELPFTLRDGSDQSTLYAARTLQPIPALANCGKGSFSHTIAAGALVLYRSDEPYPPRLWIGEREYHIISPEDILLQITYGDEDDLEDEEFEETYGDILDDVYADETN